MRGEFLAVTFSWEIIGPGPKFGCRLVVVVVRVEQYAPRDDGELQGVI